MFDSRRPSGRFLCWLSIGILLLTLNARLVAASARTTRVTDTVYRADGTPARGTILISWPAFTANTGEAVAAGRTTVTIGADGLVDVPLVANTGSTPASFYTVVLKLDDGTTATEYWTVPSAVSTTVSAIRSKVVPAGVAVQFLARDYVDTALAAKANDTAVVHYAGDETIGGTKTFTANPVVPTPTAGPHAANKGYVDSAVQASFGNVLSATPTASQIVTQPAGTSLQVNRADLANQNGVRNADRFASIQSAIDDAGTTGSVLIPPGYAGQDNFTNPNARPIEDIRKLGDARGGFISVKDFGARGDGGYYPLSGITAGSKIIGFNQAAYGWTATPGKRICIAGAGPSGADFCSTIVSVSGSNITVQDAASTTVSGRGAYWGYDDAPAIQAAVNYCQSIGGCTLTFPAGQYLLGSTVTVGSYNGVKAGRVTFLGQGGRQATKLVSIAADQTPMIQAAANSVPVSIRGLAFESYDYTAKRGTGVYFSGGTEHEVYDSWFGQVYYGIRASNTWLNYFWFNRFYGPSNSCIKFDASTGPVIQTQVAYNELGWCGKYAVEQVSAGQGGANYNSYLFNDCEGPIKNGCFYLKSDNYATFQGNRFEVEESQAVQDGTFRLLYLDNSPYAWVANNIFGGGGSVMAYKVTINGANSKFFGNQWFVPGTSGKAVECLSCSGVAFFGDSIARSWFGGASAYQVALFGDNAEGLVSSSSMKLTSGDPYKADTLMLNGKGFSSLSMTDFDNGRPNAIANAQWNAGDVIFNAAFGGASAYGRNQFAAWVCNTSTGCKWDGSAWTGNFAYVPASQCRAFDGTAPPTAGGWRVCDQIRNTAATEQGTAGSKYLVIGWYCVGAGSPGTWVPMRVLTGN